MTAPPTDGPGPAGPVPADQVRAHRFTLRRAASALVRRDAVPAVDPLRGHGRATTAGVVLAVVALGAAALVGLLDRPTGWRAAGVVVGEPSGALYVVGHGPDRLVPVPNLASARLVGAALATADTGTDTSGDPVEADDAELASAPHTRPVGIADAPPLPPAGTAAPPVWAVCDTALADPAAAAPWARPRVSTGVVAAPAAPGRPLGPGEGLVLRDRFGGFWLVHDGVRQRIDTDDAAVVVALELGGVLPRPVTTSLLNAVAEGPPIVRPAIAGRGTRAPVDLAGEPVGGVVRLQGAGVPDRWFVVLADGLAEVPPLVARLVRLSDPDPARAASPVPTVSPGQVSPVPVSRGASLSAYPDPAPALVPLPDAPTTCAVSTAGAPGVVLTVAAVAPPAGTALRGADGSGDRVDTAAVPGGGLFVRGVPTGRADAPGTLAVVSGSGTAHGVPDPATAAQLGLLPDGADPDGAATTVPAVPQAVLGLLPTGAPLTVQAATAPLG